MTLTAQPDEGVEFLGWYDKNGALLDSQLSFSFPAQKDTQIYGIFNTARFRDVRTDHWYYQDVTKAANRGIVDGTAPFVFEAEGNLTRAMAVTMLARAMGYGDYTVQEAPFTDVPMNQWFVHSLGWAKEHQVVEGISETEFAPNAFITREEFVTVLMRYVNQLRQDGQTLAGEAPAIADLDQVSDYALEHITAALEKGLLKGYPDGTLRPQGRLTRAEGVAILLRLTLSLENGEI